MLLTAGWACLEWRGSLLHRHYCDCHTAR
jgi:hypothetical protein